MSQSQTVTPPLGGDGGTTLRLNTATTTGAPGPGVQGRAQMGCSGVMFLRGQIRLRIVGSSTTV